MRILTFATICTAAVLSLTSCSKQYETKVSDDQTGNGAGGGNSGGSFNWTGTAPMSAKANGIPFLATSTNVTAAFGYYYISGVGDDGTSIGVNIPSSATDGQVFSFPTPANISWMGPSSAGTIVLGGVNGKCKLIANTATTLEGVFWADTKDYSLQRDTVVKLTEGYFKVDKP